jgi:hypothetical protein
LASLVGAAGWASVELGLTDVLAAGAVAESRLVRAAGGVVTAGFGLAFAALWAALSWAGFVDGRGWLTGGLVLMDAAPAGVFAVAGLVEAGASAAFGWTGLAGSAG